MPQICHLPVPQRHSRDHLHSLWRDVVRFRHGRDLAVGKVPAAYTSRMAIMNGQTAKALPQIRALPSRISRAAIRASDGPETDLKIVFAATDHAHHQGPESRRCPQAGSESHRRGGRAPCPDGMQPCAKTASAAICAIHSNWPDWFCLPFHAADQNFRRKVHILSFQNSMLNYFSTRAAQSH